MDGPASAGLGPRTSLTAPPTAQERFSASQFVIIPDG
jgi:hypothetical protein